MIVHKPPTVATVKRLFAVSGNQCAFERCELSLVEKTSGKVTGRICHINARRENGPRFDYNQTEEQNMAFDNLILMCPIHHDVIDSDSKSYTNERLIELKQAHQIKFSAFKDEEICDDTIQKFIQNINIDKIKINSYFSLSNVNHSQIAETIVNNKSEAVKLFALERQISSLRLLESVYSYILPEKLHPDMDWEDALLDIAMRFDNIKVRIKKWLINFSGFYNNETEKKLKECISFCVEGRFETSQYEFEANKDAYNYANKLFENFTELLADYKDDIRNKINNCIA